MGFVHAFPLSRLMWEGEVAFFEKNFQPLTVDLPGFGDSLSQKDEVSMAEMAEEAVGDMVQFSAQKQVHLAESTLVSM